VVHQESAAEPGITSIGATSARATIEPKCQYREGKCVIVLASTTNRNCRGGIENPTGYLPITRRAGRRFSAAVPV